jgi:hypothetical protein
MFGKLLSERREVVRQLDYIANNKNTAYHLHKSLSNFSMVFSVLDYFAIFFP